MVQAIRRFACRVQGSMSGRCTFARLDLGKYDPGSEVSLKPIYDWARAAWDQWVEKGDLHKARRIALTEVGAAPDAFRAVSVPAGAFVASAMRIGWKIPAAHVVVNSDGKQLDLRRVCPKQLVQYAERDLRHLEAVTSTTAARIGGAPDLEPLRDYLTSKKGRKMPGQASLRAMGEGGWWTQQRLFVEGVAGVLDDKCRACPPSVAERGSYAPTEPSAGTFIHRAAQCCATKALRAGYKDQDVLQEAERRGDPRSGFTMLPLYQHGLPLLQEVAEPPTAVERTCGGMEWPWTAP